jgi:hypothetical protein
MTRHDVSLTGPLPAAVTAVVRCLRSGRVHRGRPWALSLEQRVVIACTRLRTHLMVRELAAAHRIVTDIVQRIAALARAPRSPTRLGRRWNARADARSPRRCQGKDYRWSCNAQVLIRRTDLHVIAISGCGPGNRNDPIHYRGTEIEHLCQWHGRVLADGGYRGVRELVTPVSRGRRILRNHVWRRHRRRRARAEHAIARLKDWRVLRDHRRRGRRLIESLRAVALLLNLNIELRNKS